MNPIKLLLLCGGKSAEHEISLISAWNLLNGIENSSFDVTLVGIDKGGNWFLQDIKAFLDQKANPKTIDIQTGGGSILLKPGKGNQKLFVEDTGTYLPELDVVFPLLHGPNGEDGRIQGVLEYLQLPYVGPGVLGSAVCMDKDVAKRLMQHGGIPTSDFITLHKSNQSHPSYENVRAKLGEILFVKPANLGSSVGINKVRDEAEYENALKEAFSFDEKIIIEEFVEGKEVEFAVLGNTDCVVSSPGAYTYSDDFFDYETKYLKNDEVRMEIPPKALSAEQIKELKGLALQTYKALNCIGLARVDIFVTPEGHYLVNEVNTIPGFTQNSMYPILMEDCGISYNNLIIRLCQLAMGRSQESL